MALTEHDYALANEDERRLKSVAAFAIGSFIVVVILVSAAVLAVWR